VIQTKPVINEGKRFDDSGLAKVFKFVAPLVFTIVGLVFGAGITYSTIRIRLDTAWKELDSQKPVIRDNTQRIDRVELKQKDILKFLDKLDQTQNYLISTVGEVKGDVKYLIKVVEKGSR
jgi:hypothetical protein